MADEYVTLDDGTVARVASLEEYNDATKKRADAERKAKAAARRAAERKSLVLEDVIAERDERRERRRRANATETPEQINARRAADAARQRSLYHGQTPEDLEQSRELRRQRVAAQRNTETPSQREARLASQRERVARHRASKRATTHAPSPPATPSLPVEVTPTPWIDPAGNLEE